MKFSQTNSSPLLASAKVPITLAALLRWMAVASLFT